MALLLFGPALTAQAEINWKSGVEMGHRPSHESASLALSELSQNGSGQHIVVQFSEPVTLEQRVALETLGVGLLSYLGNNTFFASLKTSGLDLDDLWAALTLTSAMTIEQEWKIAPSILAGEYPDFAIAMDTDTKQARVAAYVMFHKDVPLDQGWALARAHKATVVSEIVSIPFMTETNDSNSVVTQADTAQASPYNLDGSGIGVLVYDAGYALQSHGDFSGRLTVRDRSTLSDHATHVSGTIGGGGQYGGPDPTSGYTGNNVYGYNLSGDYENSLPERHLTTTAVNCSALSDVSLSFRRWLGVELSTYDHAYIRVSDDGSSWTTVWQNPDSATEDASWSLQSYDISAVALTNTYSSPVVVCTVNYSSNAIPVVARVSNVTANSFDVRLQNPSNSAVATETVSYIVMEEGTWTIDGVNCEAQTYLSTVTDENNSWNGETQTYGQSYTSPVVLGHEPAHRQGSR